MTGQPCKRCGETERYARGGCKTCARNRSIASYYANPQKHSESSRASYAARKAADPEKINAKSRAWAAANREGVRATGAAYRAAHPDYDRNRKAAWRAANPEGGKQDYAARKAADPEYVAKKYAAHREINLASSKARYAANPETGIARAAAWRAANPEKARALDLAKVANNPEAYREYRTLWRRKHSAIAIRHQTLVDLTSLKESLTMNMKQMSNEQIIAGLQAGLSLSAKGLCEAAPYYVEARERGLDLSGISSPMLAYLPDVAAGRLDAEMLIRFGGLPPVMAAVATLLPEEQRAVLANDGKINVIDPSGKVREARMAGLSKAQLSQVIDTKQGRIRTTAEQRPHLSATSRPVRPVASRDEWNLREALSAEQMVQVTANAEKLGITPAEYAVRCMVNYKWIKDKPAHVTAETRHNLEAALSRRPQPHV